MSNQDREWTDVDLDRLRQMDDHGRPIPQIAEALQRSPSDIEDRLSIVRARAPGPAGPDEEGDVPMPRDARDDSAAWVHTNAGTGMTQSISPIDVAGEASRVDDDAVTIAADDAGVTAATQKIGAALEDAAADIATSELGNSDNRAQQASSPIVGGAKNAASTEVDLDLIRQAKENAKVTDEQMRQSSFGDHKGSEGL